ncbi:CBS domain-containing protein [Roseibacterium sp. SDUM158017]|uniref:CBS domain-containing protein n=1 Tax=Roseicyclus salinarum TaxID=3036773 RepID=UPI0024155534|nr:CBS domain-containing protein [Roseibacterium sp. SDUM158017]MDG4648482.1 CBS domain-containing protein [Roseibacterium sp. SDUM158017]
MPATDRVAMTLRDRPEFASKPKPLTFAPDATVKEAVAAMTARRFGSVIVTDEDSRVLGVVTERDIMSRLVHEDRDAATTRLSEIMTADPRVARETDDLLDWLRIMSNERFRRLPVVDEENRIKAVFTQGDFVSFTWPDLIYQAGQMAKATIFQQWHLWLVGGGIALYSILMIIVLAVVT